MLIQVNTDSNVSGREKLVLYIEGEIGRLLSRFVDHITRLEIHLSDENGDKPGNTDKRCLMEARLAGRPPVVVSHDDDTVEAAWTGATKKLLHLLESTLGRASDRNRGASIRANDNGE